MAIVTKSTSSKNRVNFVWKQVSTPVAQSSSFTEGTWSEGWTRNVSRVDPFNRLLHGYYYAVGTARSNSPYVQGALRYKSPFSGASYAIDVSGTAHGYAVPQIRWLLSSESQKALLINNCIKGIQSEQVSLAQFVGELDKTASLFASKAKRISSAASKVRAGKFSSAARTLGIQKPLKASRSKTFAQNWLEFSYGWSPLVADAVGMMQHLSQQARGLTVRSRSRVNTSVPTVSSSQVNLGQEGASQHRFLCDFLWKGTWVRNEQVCLVYRLNDWFWDQVSRLGFTNPTAIAWESVPLSFVVDWFANIGDIFGAMDLGLTLEFVTASHTEYHRHTGVTRVKPLWADLRKPSFYKYSLIEAFGTDTPFQEWRVRRHLIQEHEVVMSFFLSSPLSVNHATTATALVVQALHKP